MAMSPVYLVSAKQKMRQHLPPRECETVNCFSSAGQQVESLFGRGTRRFLVGENDCLNSVKSEFVEKRRKPKRLRTWTPKMSADEDSAEEGDQRRPSPSAAL